MLAVPFRVPLPPPGTIGGPPGDRLFAWREIVRHAYCVSAMPLGAVSKDVAASRIALLLAAVGFEGYPLHLVDQVVAALNGTAFGTIEQLCGVQVGMADRELTSEGYLLSGRRDGLVSVTVAFLDVDPGDHGDVGGHPLAWAGAR